MALQKHNILFSILSISVLCNFISKGYIFGLDLIYTPKTIYDRQELSSLYPDQNLLFRSLIEFFANVVPMYNIEKMILFITLSMAGISVYRLLPGTKIAKYFAGIFYMVNPFVYARFLAGHIRLLTAYIILPFAIKSFIDTIENMTRKNIINTIILTACISIFNVQMVVITFLIYAIIIIFKLVDNNEDISIYTRFKYYIKILTFISLGWFLINIYWILPFAVNNENIVTQFDNRDFDAFAPNIENDIYGLFEIAAMYGFWREEYIYAKDFIPGWQILYSVILSLAILGFLTYYKDEKIGYLVMAFGFIAILGLILALGTKGPLSILYEFDNPILKGFRDSHKFVAMLVLSYSILGGLGINKLDEMRRKINAKNCV